MPKMSLSGKNSENFEIFFYTFQRIETLKDFPKKSCNSFQCLGHVNSVSRQNCATTFGRSHSFVYFMCGSNLLSYVPPSGLFHFFHSAKYICMWKVKSPWGVCTTVYFTVELSPGLKNLFKNSTMVPDASNLVLSNLWVKFNVVYTPFLIFSLFAIMCILQNEKSEIIPRGVCTTTNLNHTLGIFFLLFF